eukprot:scaffold7215_cov366-Prasinococcus_capsulatus_cf.AAC.25
MPEEAGACARTGARWLAALGNGGGREADYGDREAGVERLASGVVPSEKRDKRAARRAARRTMRAPLAR